METITIPKSEYKRLVKRARSYDKLTKQILADVISEPIPDIVSDFRKTNLYSEGFLKDLESGLKKSSHAKGKT